MRRFGLLMDLSLPSPGGVSETDGCSRSSGNRNDGVLLLLVLLRSGWTSTSCRRHAQGTSSSSDQVVVAGPWRLQGKLESGAPWPTDGSRDTPRASPRPTVLRTPGILRGTPLDSPATNPAIDRQLLLSFFPIAP